MFEFGNKKLLRNIQLLTGLLVRRDRFRNVEKDIPQKIYSYRIRQMRLPSFATVANLILNWEFRFENYA